MDSRDNYSLERPFIPLRQRWLSRCFEKSQTELETANFVTIIQWKLECELSDLCKCYNNEEPRTQTYMVVMAYNKINAIFMKSQDATQISRNQEKKGRITSYECSALRRRTSCRAAAIASFDAHCSRQILLACLKKRQSDSTPRIAQRFTNFARKVNKTDQATLFSDRTLLGGVEGGVGKPMRAIAANIVFSLPLRNPISDTKLVE